MLAPVPSWLGSANKVDLSPSSRVTKDDKLAANSRMGNIHIVLNACTRIPHVLFYDYWVMVKKARETDQCNTLGERSAEAEDGTYVECNSREHSPLVEQGKRG